MTTFMAYDKSELEAYRASEKNPQTDFSVITEKMAAIMRDFAKLKEHSFSDSKVQK